MSKKRIIPVSLAIISICMLFSACDKNKSQAKRMLQLENGVEDPATIEEISSAIEQYEEHIEDILLSTQQTGIWYKLLGTRYLDNQQYGKALEAFQKAIEIYPANQNLYYYAGVSAGWMAKSALDYNVTGIHEEHDRYLNLAESAYLRAIEIEPQFVRALYGLSVLYVFDMYRAADAIPYLETVLSIEKKHTDAMFVLARAYFLTEQYQKAADMYDMVLKTTTDEKLRKEAENNKKVVLDALYD